MNEYMFTQNKFAILHVLVKKASSEMLWNFADPLYVFL